MHRVLPVFSVLAAVTLSLAAPIPLGGTIVAPAVDNVDSMEPMDDLIPQDEDEILASSVDEFIPRNSTAGLLKLNVLSKVTQRPLSFRFDINGQDSFCGRSSLWLQDRPLGTWDEAYFSSHSGEDWKARWAEQLAPEEDWSDIGYVKTMDEEVIPAEWKYFCHRNIDGTSESMEIMIKLRDQDYEFRVRFDQVNGPTVLSVSNAEYSLCNFEDKSIESICPRWKWEERKLNLPDEATQIKELQLDLEFFQQGVKATQKNLEKLTGKPAELSGLPDTFVNSTIHIFGVLCTLLGLFSLTGLCVLRGYMRRRRLSKPSSNAERTARRLQRRERRRQRREKRKALKQSLRGILTHFNFSHQPEEQPDVQNDTKTKYEDEKAAMLLDVDSEPENTPAYTASTTASQRTSVEDELAGLGRVVSLVSDIISISHGRSRSRRPSETDSLPPYSDLEDGQPPSYQDDF